MEIKASSVYDWKTIKQFYRFHNFGRNGIRKAMPIIYAVAVAIFIFCFVLAVIGDYVDGEMISLLVIEVLIILLLAFIYFILPKINFNKNRLLKNGVNNFVFKETEFTVEGASGLYNGCSEMKYEGLHKIYETKDYIYLYITPFQSYIVEKSKIEDGRESDLRKLLINTVGEKYKMVFK